MNKVVNLLFPARAECPLCGQPYVGESCPQCIKVLAGNKSNFCVRCGRIIQTGTAHRAICRACTATPPVFRFARSVGLFEGLLKEAVYSLKYTGKQSIARLLASLMVEVIVKDDRFLDVQCVVPVPLHEKKLCVRSFNQADLLASEISKLLFLPIDRECLVRTRASGSQSKLNAQMRRRNVLGVFEMLGRSLAGKRVLLVDDVLTTGATAGECARVILEAGAREVALITLATGQTR